MCAELIYHEKILLKNTSTAVQCAVWVDLLPFVCWANVDAPAE